MNLPIELNAWAQRHGVSPQALQELSATLGIHSVPQADDDGSETRVQSLVRLRAPYVDMKLWRNNVGVLINDVGVPVRFGLANDSKKLNEQLKSSDLVGWRRVIITPDMIGKVIAQFVALECKKAGWKYAGTDREQAQARWLSLAAADGGYTKFITGPGEI